MNARRFFTVFALFITALVHAQQPQANLFTIPNQSTQFVRMPARHASQEIDAVFFNPAGAVALEDGFHLSLNNQILNQWTSVESEYSQFRDGRHEYSGHVTGFVFPSIFATYNTGRWSVQAGFNMIGGTGGVEYGNLPIAERGLSDIPQALVTNLNLAQLDAEQEALTGTDPMYRNITDYRYKFQNQGLGYSPGLQVNVGFEVTDMVQVAVGGRFLMQTQRSEGYTTDIEIYNEQNGGWVQPGNYLRAIGAETNNPFLTNVASVYDELAVDRQIDVKQSGFGFSPIVSVNVEPSDRLNIGLKYEHRARMSLTTTVYDGKHGGQATAEDRTVFVDGEEVRSDIPGFVAAGISYDVFDQWTVAGGMRYMFIQNAEMNGREDFISGNYYELEFGTEYRFSKRFLVSGGYTWNHPGVEPGYQNEVDFWVPGHTVALGGGYSISKAVMLNMGAMYTRFLDRSYTYDDHVFAQNTLVPVSAPEGYDNTYTMDTRKSAFIFAVGVDIDFRAGRLEARAGDVDTEYDATDF